MLGTITLTVGQPDGVSVAQKEEAPETTDTIQDEVAPQVNGEKMEKESPDANDITAIEEKAAEEKPEDASEVGFKKIFRFVGFKFTLKKDKSEEKDPVKLLTVKDKEGEEVSKTEEPTKETEATTAEEKGTTEEEQPDTEASAAEVEVIKESDKAETPDAQTEGTATEVTDEAVKEEVAEKEAETTPPAQETAMSPLRKFFNVGLFSNLRKKASIKKTKEEEDKEAAVEEETAKTEETASAVEEQEEKDVAEQETKEATPETPVEGTTEPKDEAPATPEEVKSEITPEPEVTVEAPVPAETTTDETKQEEEKAEPCAEEEKAPAEVTSEAEMLSSQEKAKPQGSPLKKLFTGAGLKKLSTKKQKAKKETETKVTESGEQAAEQLQSSTESAEAPKADSGASSPEESGEHVIAVEVPQNESSQETDGEVVSDGEKKKEGIIAWSSFKKLVTPKKRVKRSSESEDEATGDKPAKSATLSSSESAALADKSVEEEAKEDKPTEEEPKTENTEKLVSSTEEPKKKMDTSVSWEALMCMGGPKKRSRRTSDSDDEETKIEGELPAAAEGEQEGKAEAAIVTSQNSEREGEVVSSLESSSSHPERESAWDTLKRIVMPKNKAKVEEKPEESAEQVQSDSEAPKDESSFSLKKFLPGRRKKKAEKQASTEQGSSEEESDTPAVVPLSEYNDQAEAEQEAAAEPAAEPVAEPAAVQTKVSAEDRSPSWIPATVEDSDDKHEELSDIPEEAENTATPKSVDTDIAEDETEDEPPVSPKALEHRGRRLSTAEVKPVAPTPSAETTPVPQGPKPESAEEVMAAVEAQVSALSPQTSVTTEDLPIEVASEKTEYEPPTEKAETKTTTILEPHAREEAMAICTGLGTKEIAKVALEKPAMPIVECVAVIRDGLSTEVSMEEKPPCTEEAIVKEEAILKAQLHQVETTELEPAVENSLSGVADIQAASESCEPQIEKVGIVSTAEVLQTATMSENSPKVVVVSPITPTTEAAVCTPSTEITEANVEIKDVKMDMQQLAATEENTPVKEVVEALCETTKVTLTKEAVPDIPVVVPSEEVPVVTKAVILIAPPCVEADQVAATDVVTMSEPDGDEQIQQQETKEESTAVDTTALTVVQTADSETSAITDQASKTMEEIKDDVQQESEIEAQSMVIAQAVIQDAMDQVTEEPPEPSKPTTPTASTPAPVQAIATTEKEIETTKEMPFITEAPVVVTCEKPPQSLCVAMEVTDTIPVEVTQSLDASEEEQKKPEEGLKKAVEVKVSEETVIVEEVVEIKAESQTGEELEQIKEEESKEDTGVQETDVKEAAKEVEPQSEEAKSEAPSEEDKEKVIHMPVQVVLQTAQVIEEPSVEEEAVEEFDSNGPVAEDTSVKAEHAASENKLSTLSEETQVTESAEVSSPSQDTEAAASQPETEKNPSAKCAEVMAQVIEVIEEAVKEIEPSSTEITAAS
uniref:A-kinase anchor protein 12b isoform X2 n=1 Tax=Scatophagus argus TaxID=75038 RepID=UPI001ED83B92|nr:A-kinase anchor protein 12b isoform X2 [Scatophagus argus]